MNNRKLSSPIFYAAILSLFSLATRPSLAQSDTASDSTEPVDANPAGNVAATPAPALPVISYTVVRGDTLTSIAHKFGLTLKQLKRLNDLPTTKVSIKRGEILQVVSVNGANPAVASHHGKKKHHASYAVAQPVQGFDVTGSTGASDTVPLAPSGDNSAPPVSFHQAPVAQLVSPAELAADEAQNQTAPVAETPASQETDNAVSSSFSSKHAPRALPVPIAEIAPQTPSIAPANPPAVKPPSRNPFARWFSSSEPETDWGSRFLLQARTLADRGIEYDEDWRPPGESHSWSMDCSNTTRYLYRVTAGIELPRTASDQYYYLHLQGKAWDVPELAQGVPDVKYLSANLKPGDLLFWENTYRPERQPPITHVMIYLGTNEKGQWLMAGSQSSRGGEHNRRNGGPDVYVFRPSQPCGGYSTWLGLVHHKGRFCAFGRPLEADRSKLAVATD